MADYTSLINRIESRYNPDSLREVRLNSISSLSGIDKDIAKYVKLAMNEVDPIYTNKTLEAGENAKLHFTKRTTAECRFSVSGFRNDKNSYSWCE